MASAKETHAREPLKYRVFDLRVPMHCEGCKKKVKKVLQAIDGVYLTSIEMSQQKVTVIGNIHPQVVIQKLAKKTRKRAELWPEQPKPMHKEWEEKRKEDREKGEKDDSDATGESSSGSESEAKADSDSKKGTGGNGGGGESDGGGGGGSVKFPYYPSPMAEYTVSYCVEVHGSNGGSSGAPPVEVHHHHHHHLQHSRSPPPPTQQLGYGNSSGVHSYSPSPAVGEEWSIMFSDENANNCRVM